MSPAVVDTVYSREELKEALRELPTISITTDVDNLFGRRTGIQLNPEDSGVRSEASRLRRVPRLRQQPRLPARCRYPG